MGAGPVTCKDLEKFRHQLYNGHLYNYPPLEGQDFFQQHNYPRLDMDPFSVLSGFDAQDLQEGSPVRESPLYSEKGFQEDQLLRECQLQVPLQQGIAELGPRERPPLQQLLEQLAEPAEEHGISEDTDTNEDEVSSYSAGLP